jgi:predicted PurR-regulated permease PerM
VRQTREFIQEVPTTVSNFQKQNSSLSRAARHYHIDEKLSQAAHDFTSHYNNFGSTALNTGKLLIGTLVSILAVLALAFMMLVEGPRWLDLIWGLTPEKDRAHRKKLAHRMYKAVTGFVNGQVILALIAGSFAFVALEIASHILNVSINPVALAGIVAALGIIPLFGNPISSSLVVAVCLLNSVTLGIVMLIYFLVYYQIENLTLQPYIQSRINELTALSVFVAAIIGIGFAGFLGAIIAIPAASAIKILLEDHFEDTNKHHAAPTEGLTLS